MLHLCSGYKLSECLLPVNVSALKIHMSEYAHEAVMAFPEFITELRGEIPIKVIYIYIVFPLSCIFIFKA